MPTTPSLISALGAKNTTLVYDWALANGETGDALGVPNYPERSVQVFGTFGEEGSVNLEGSIDGTNYAVLTDPLGNALTFTAAGIANIAEAVRYVRPDVTAGDGTTALAITVLFKKP